MQTDTQQQNELGTAPVGRLLLRLALPNIAAQIVNMLYNIVDRIYIGHNRCGRDLSDYHFDIGFQFLNRYGRYAPCFYCHGAAT